MKLKFGLLSLLAILVLNGCAKKQYAFFGSAHHDPYTATTKMPILENEQAVIQEEEPILTASTNEAFVPLEAEKLTIKKKIAITKSAIKLAPTVNAIKNAKSEIEVKAIIQKDLSTIKKTIDAIQPAEKTVGRNQLVAAILCWFVGIVGIHRFYLGYTTEGILQIITLGGCGIWTLIDLIRIITGDLQPKGTTYSKSIDQAFD